MRLISKLRAPAGVLTTTSSPSILPIRLRPTGDVVEIKPCAGHFLWCHQPVSYLFIAFGIVEDEIEPMMPCLEARG